MLRHFGANEYIFFLSLFISSFSLSHSLYFSILFSFSFTHFFLSSLSLFFSLSFSLFFSPSLSLSFSPFLCTKSLQDEDNHVSLQLLFFYLIDFCSIIIFLFLRGTFGRVFLPYLDGSYTVFPFQP